MIASVDTDKTRQFSCRCSQSRELFQSDLWEGYGYNLGLKSCSFSGLRGVFERSDISLSLQPVLFQRPKAAGRGTRASLMVSDVHVHRSQLATSCVL